MRPVEFRRKRTFFCVIEADALADEFKAATDRERGGRQNDGVEGFEQAFAEDLANVDGSCRQKDALVATFIPIHKIFLVGFEEKREFLTNLETAAREAGEFLGLLRQRGELGFESFQRGRERVVGFAVLFEKGGALGAREWKASIARWKGVEKFARTFADALGAAKQCRGAEPKHAQ